MCTSGRGKEGLQSAEAFRGVYKEVESALILLKNGEKGKPEFHEGIKDGFLGIRVCRTIAEEDSTIGKKDPDNELRLRIIKIIKSRAEDAFLIECKKEFKELRQGRTR